jgi:hypothetical protein
MDEEEMKIPKHTRMSWMVNGGTDKCLGNTPPTTAANIKMKPNKTAAMKNQAMPTPTVAKVTATLLGVFGD